MKKNVLIVNWGTETSILILKECLKLNNYDFYLASTSNIPLEIKKIFKPGNIIITNPYDAKKLCCDVDVFIKDKKIKFDIVTTFFEMCVFQTAFLAKFLKIDKALSLDSAERTSVNKYLMRSTLKKAGIRQPKFYKFNKSSIQQAFIFFKKVKTDFVIKPIHSGHSYGVRFIYKNTNFNHFKKTVQSAIDDYKNNYDEWMKYEDIKNIDFILEEFISGNIYSFDGLVKEKVNFIGSTQFELSPLPMMQQIGNTTPIFSLNSQQINNAKNYIKKIIKTLNLKYCGFHCELKFIRNSPVLIEISGRLPGGVISNSYQHISKINIFDNFFSIFRDDDYISVKNKDFYKSETMKIIYSDKNIGIVKNLFNQQVFENKNFICQIRSRENGETIIQKKDNFGIWLYEINLKSKTISSKKLVQERDKIINQQKVKVVFKINLFFLYLINNIKVILKSINK